MLKTLSILFVAVLAGCAQKPSPSVPTSDGNVVTQADDSYQICKDGVVYIKFGYGENSWGGAKFDKDSKVVLCGSETTDTKQSHNLPSIVQDKK